MLSCIMQIKGQKRPAGLQFLREGGYDFNESKVMKWELPELIALDKLANMSIMPIIDQRREKHENRKINRDEKQDGSIFPTCDG